ncbi:hypothetical protein TNCT_254601 [Trichonephila clavata]|uniref:Uncharacterized protein n=1 Tax=Trichonephila clavata TaxID=2740835 RepID=A0A8X6G1D9_TRICU|nr:hypothetical protein TNCT_254601 [Trichonephila clavata]
MKASSTPVGNEKKKVTEKCMQQFILPTLFLHAKVPLGKPFANRFGSLTPQTSSDGFLGRNTPPKSRPNPNKVQNCISPTVPFPRDLDRVQPWEDCDRGCCHNNFACVSLRMDL